MTDFGYEKLGVWQKGIDLVEQVYELTKSFPNEERFGLTSQMRRAAVSIPANIAEGFGRNSKPHLANFARTSLGSLYELRTELEIAVRIGLATREQTEHVVIMAVELSKMLDGFIRNIGD